MTTTAAPAMRFVDQLTGWKGRPSRWWQANAEADVRIAEVDRLRAWQRRVADALGISECGAETGGLFVCPDADRAAEYAREAYLAVGTADELAEKVDRLQRDNGMLRRQLDALLASSTGELHCRIEELTAENSELAERLMDLQESHLVTLGLLAEARRAKAGGS